jgi:hypothetical protein
MGGYPPQGVPKGVTKHTELTDKEVAGVIDHANGSVTDAKLASGVGLSDGQICKLPTATEGKVLRRGATAWEAGDVPAPSANEILEAMAKFNGIWWFNNHWIPEGMVSSNTPTGVIEWGPEDIGLRTGAVASGYATIWKHVSPDLVSGYPSWDKKRYLRMDVFIHAISNQIIHLVSGGISYVLSAENIVEHIGFKFVNATLYGTVGNGTAESTLEIETLTEGVAKRLECELDPDAGECRFYVDDEYKGEITTNLPTGDNLANIPMGVSICTTENVDKALRVISWRFLQYE